MLFMEKDENGFQNFSIRILESTESLRQVVLDEFENFIFNSNIMSGVNKIDEPTLLSLICESHKSEYIREFIVEMLPLLEQSCIAAHFFKHTGKRIVQGVALRQKQIAIETFGV